MRGSWKHDRVKSYPTGLLIFLLYVHFLKNLRFFIFLTAFLFSFFKTGNKGKNKSFSQI